MKPVLHLIGLFHTVPNSSFSHCAFTGKVLRFSKMMQDAGYDVIEYANGKSESEALTKVRILEEKELLELTGLQKDSDFHGNTAIIGSPHWTEFSTRLKEAIGKRVAPRDIICHPFGRSHADLAGLFKEQYHVETGIGYPDAEFGAYRIFETHAWLHWHAGRSNKPVSDYTWVVPNYYDVTEWPVRTEPGSYYLYFGRITQTKGMDVLRAIADHISEDILVVGQGDLTPWQHPRLKYMPPVTGKDRGNLLANAKAILMPTRFVEPFGGSGVEGQLCGVPLISSDFGGFAETVEHGNTGFRCHNLGDWLVALDVAPKLDREYIANRARRLYSLEACGRRYDSIFHQISDLKLGGWYQKSSRFIHLPEVH